MAPGNITYNAVDNICFDISKMHIYVSIKAYVGVHACVPASLCACMTSCPMCVSDLPRDVTPSGQQPPAVYGRHEHTTSTDPAEEAIEWRRPTRLLDQQRLTPAPTSVAIMTSSLRTRGSDVTPVAG